MPMDDHSLRVCNECGTIFKPDVADPDRSGAPRCPQCFLTSSTVVEGVNEGDFVIRNSTPFR